MTTIRWMTFIIFTLTNSIWRWSGQNTIFKYRIKYFWELQIKHKVLHVVPTLLHQNVNNILIFFNKLNLSEKCTTKPLTPHDKTETIHLTARVKKKMKMYRISKHESQILLFTENDSDSGYNTSADDILLKFAYQSLLNYESRENQNSSTCRTVMNQEFVFHWNKSSQKKFFLADR